MCTPVTIELWGHGRSPTPRDEQMYLPQHYIEQLEHIRRELGITQWFLGGYSISAGITIRYAIEHPRRVYAHFFTNSSSAFADAELINDWQKNAAANHQRIMQGGQDAIQRIPVHPRYAKRIPAEIAQPLLEDAKRLTAGGVASAMSVTTPNACVRDIVANNLQPALLCFGMYEKRFHESKRWISQNMAHVQIASLSAGHAVNMEDASGFNQVVSEFLLAHQQ